MFVPFHSVLYYDIEFNCEVVNVCAPAIYLTCSYYSGDEAMAATVAGIHGTIGEFNSTQEDWTSYVERLQQYFAANDVAESKQRAVLLSACGVATYCLIENFLAPENPADKSCSASQTDTGSP